MTYHYRGHNGSVVMGSDKVEIVRTGFTARLLGLANRQAIIPLADITDLAYQRPSILVNGYVRLAVRGRTARQLSPSEANSHPDAVTFTFGQRRDFDKLVAELHQRISNNSTGGHDVKEDESPHDVAAAVSQIPRTEQELATVASYRPSHWEYQLFAGLLLSGMDQLEDKWHEHEFRYARKELRIDDTSEAMAYLSDALTRISNICQGVEQLLTPRNNILAFGAPGSPGDPNRIRILASRLIEIYESLLDWSINIRRVAVIEELQETFEIAAQITDEPLEGMRKFVRMTAVEIERIIDLSDRDALGDRNEFVLTLTLTTDDGLMEDFSNSLARAKKRLRI